MKDTNKSLYFISVVLFIILIGSGISYGVSNSSSKTRVETSSSIVAKPDAAYKPAPITATIPKKPSSVSAMGYTCEIDTTGALFCWGKNSFGRLGIGDATIDVEVKIPQKVGSESDWAQIAGHGGYAFAIKRNGKVYSWGAKEGEGMQSVPVESAIFDSGNVWKSIAAGNEPGHVVVFAVKWNGELWRYDETGGLERIGTGSDWESVSVNEDNRCGLKTAKTLWCWGRNNHGEVGNGNENNVTEPYQVMPDAIKSYAVGPDHTCAVKTDGSLWCWGRGDIGQLGLGSTISYNSPVQVGTSKSWKQVSAADDVSGTHAGGHTCAVKEDGSLWCWGGNKWAQLGLGGTFACEYYGELVEYNHPCNRNTPYKVGGDSDWMAVYVGPSYSCAKKQDDSTYCWGSNRDGELGVGEGEYKDMPTKVLKPTSVMMRTIMRP